MGRLRTDFLVLGTKAYMNTEMCEEYLKSYLAN